MDRGKGRTGVEGAGRGGWDDKGEVKTGGVCIWMALCQKSSESNLEMFLGNQRSTRWGCSSERAAIS